MKNDKVFVATALVASFLVGATLAKIPSLGSSCERSYESDWQQGLETPPGTDTEEYA